MDGWRIAYNDGNYTVKYNDTIVFVSVHVSSGVSYKTTEQTFGAEILKDSTRGIDLRPPMPISNYSSGGIWLWIVDNNYAVKYQATTNKNSGAYASFTYARK